MSGRRPRRETATSGQRAEPAKPPAPTEPPPVLPPELVPTDVAAAVQRMPNCTHCGGRHVRACPRVKRMSFHPNGALAAVEFWPDGKWSDEHVLWDEEIGDGT